VSFEDVVRIELVDNSKQFAAMQAEWTELLASSTAESPFLTWEWLNAWWAHLCGPRRLTIIAVRDGERLIAVAPFCASRGRLPFLWRYELMGTGFAGSDYLDAIVRSGYEVEAMRLIADYIKQQDAAVQLVRLPANSSLSRLAAPLAERGWSVRAAADGFCPFIRLAGHTWDSFLSTIGPSHRATTRRRLRTLEKNFTMRFTQIADDAMRQFALAKLFDFHRARFGRRGTAFHTKALRDLHLDVTQRLQRAGTLRLFMLHLNDALVGVMYGMSFKGRFYFYQHGYDPAFQAQGVGRAVLDMSIRAAIAEGLSEFDLLWGGEAYKSAWTNEKRPLTRYEFFPADLAGRVHRRAVETERTLRAVARRIISAHAPQTS
jgi:CelD/BcsL family acetyltransferase involved in cellulose biosynthesis